MKRNLFALWALVLAVCVCTGGVAVADPSCDGPYEIEGEDDCLLTVCPIEDDTEALVTWNCREGLFEELGFRDAEILTTLDGEGDDITVGAGFEESELQYVPAEAYDFEPDPESSRCNNTSNNFFRCNLCSMLTLAIWNPIYAMADQGSCWRHCVFNGAASICNQHGCNPGTPGWPGCSSGCTHTAPGFPECCGEVEDCLESPPGPSCPVSCTDPEAQLCQPWPQCQSCMLNPSQCEDEECTPEFCVPECPNWDTQCE